MRQYNKFLLSGALLLLFLLVTWQGYRMLRNESIPVLLDTDLDGLVDEREAQAGTNPNLPDTDGDSLSDYAETVKHKTNPLKADSDGDGISDDDWNERREYAYTVRMVIKLRKPFDPEAMNDLYQDARIIEAPDEAGYTKMEAVVYPMTRAILNASVYPVKDLPKELRAYTRPGIGTNYDPDMQAKILRIAAGAKTDIEVVKRVLKWLRKETTNLLDYSIPEVYYTYVDNGEVRVRNYSDPFPAKDLLRTHYFAASMFRERTHGTCTSVAALKCAMLKAAGIPCRMIQTISPIYYHSSQTEPYSNNLSREWDRSYERLAGDDQMWVNHAFLEVYLGGQWVRVDNDLGIYNHDSQTLSLKVVSVADWSEVDFSRTWPVDWVHDRPYYTLLIEDRNPKH